MRLHLILTINAIMAIGFGIAFGLYGPLMLAMFGVPEAEGSAIMYWHTAAFARIFGAALFGFGFLIWSVRSIVADTRPGSPSTSETRRGVVFALLIANGMGLVVAGTQQVAIWNSAAGLIAVMIFTAFLLGYGYLLVKKDNLKGN